MLYGPYRVLPGRLSVSRTFGDIEAKLEKYGGKPGVVSSEPEIAQFSIDENAHDFIILACDGVYDRLTSVDVVDSAWSAMAQGLKQYNNQQASPSKSFTIHQITGKMSDAVLKSSAIERSFDNITVVIIAFKSLHRFYEVQRQKHQSKTQTIKIEGENNPSPLNQLSQVHSGSQTTKTRRAPNKLITNNQSQMEANSRLSTYSNRSNPKQRHSSSLDNQ